MKKKNHKGFTLTELLAILVILGVIVAIAVPSYNNLSKKFRNNYYEKLDETILTSAKTYFKDHAEERPVNLLESNVIDLEDLQTNNYLEDATSYKQEGKLDGYVVVIKDKDEYDYKTCLTVTKDDGEVLWQSYDISKTTDSDNENNYCNDAWKNSDAIVTGYDKDTLYLYRDSNYVNNTSNNEAIRKKLGITRTISKVYINEVGKKITLKTIKIDDNNTFYPKNITSVNLSKKAKFDLYYDVGNEEINKQLFVFEYSEPNYNIYDNEVELFLDSKKLSDLNDRATSLESYYQKIGDGKWEKINCPSLDESAGYKCTVEYSSEKYVGREELKVKYRFVDNDSEGKYRIDDAQKEGNISRETEYVKVPLQQLNSLLNVKAYKENENGEVYTGDWINKNVYFKIEGKNIEFSYRATPTGVWNDEGSIPSSKVTNVKSGKSLETTYQFADASGKNEYTKSNPKTIDVKIDKIKPTVTAELYTSEGKKYSRSFSNWTNETLTLVIKAEDLDSGIKKVTYKNSLINFSDELEDYDGDDKNRVYTTVIDSYATTISIDVEDNAGNTNSTTVDAYVDKTPPYCFITKDIENKRITVTAADAGLINKSGLSKNSLRISPYLQTVDCSIKITARTCYQYSKTGTYTATVKDKAGNTGTCEVYVNVSQTTQKEEKLLPPVIHLSSTTQTTKDVTFTITNPNDNGDIYYSYDESKWEPYTGGSVTLLNKTGTKTVYAKVVYNNVSSSISPATGYCNKDTVTVNASTLQGKYFVLSFSLPNSPSGVTPNKYEYAYWGAVDAGEDEINKQSSQATSICGSTPPTGAIEPTKKDAKTANLYMKFQKQYYCFAVRPHRKEEIEEINRWTIQRKHAKTTQTINSNNYNGYN